MAFNDLPYPNLMSIPIWHLISAPNGEGAAIYVAGYFSNNVLT
jgi:hypothetical protein